VHNDDADKESISSLADRDNGAMNLMMCACEKVRRVSKKRVGSTVCQRFVRGLLGKGSPQKPTGYPQKTWLTPENVIACKTLNAGLVNVM
jgi:hypothetical protein